jgi:hypothetical protein
MKWHVDITRERFAELAQQLEWAAIAQRARVLAKPPRTLVRLGPVPAITGTTLCLVAMLWLRATAPSLRSVATICAWAFATVLALWAVVLVQRGRSPKSVAESRRKMVARMLAPTARKLPIAVDYDLHDGQLDLVTTAHQPRNALTARTAIATPLVVALFRYRTSMMPWRIIHQPPPELLELLRERGTDVVVIDGPPAGFIDALPPARISS